MDGIMGAQECKFPSLSFLRRFTLVLIERCRKATTKSYNILQPSYPHQLEFQVSKALMKVVPRWGVEKRILVEHISTLFFLQKR